MTPTNVERVARAIYRSIYTEGTFSIKEWLDLPEDRRKRFCSAARAAIAAMKKKGAKKK